MVKLKGLIKLVAASLVMFLQLKFIEFFFVDNCLDHGGRFLYREMMCEGEKGFISFNLAPIFYILTCIIFGAIILGALKLIDRLMSKYIRKSGN